MGETRKADSKSHFEYLGDVRRLPRTYRLVASDDSIVECRNPATFVGRRAQNEGIRNDCRRIVHLSLLVQKEGKPRPQQPDAVLAAVNAKPLRVPSAALTASARGVIESRQVGTRKRPSGRTKKLTGGRVLVWPGRLSIRHIEPAACR